MFGDGYCCKIGGRRHDCRTQITGKTGADHIRFETFTEPHSRIKTRRYNIGESAFDCQIKRDIRIGFSKFTKPRCNDKLCSDVWHRNSQRARRALACFNRSSQRLMNFLKRRREPFQ
ncbi:hypothetical protein D9M68_962310 [compost metagenome]